MARLSIIVPTYNSQHTIEACLNSIKQSSFPDYEIIVVDCASNDKTAELAKKYADNVLVLSGRKTRSYARTSGLRASGADIVVNIDSDVVIKKDALANIAQYFTGHPDIDAVTGMLSREHPNMNFSSQYKNLYMHYMFKTLPDKITFLYGSIHAFRRTVVDSYNASIRIADDTALGQQLVSKGRKIALLKNLEVIHLKKYNLSTLLINDFKIPFDWAKIFLHFRGWKQLGKNNTGFAHSSKRQITAVILAPLGLLLFVTAFLKLNTFYLPVLIVLSWAALNYKFMLYLGREKGILFMLTALLFTFIDNLVMAAGIFCGTMVFLTKNG